MPVTHNHNYPLSQVAKFQFDHRLQKNGVVLKFNLPNQLPTWQLEHKEKGFRAEYHIM